MLAQKRLTEENRELAIDDPLNFDIDIGKWKHCIT